MKKSFIYLFSVITVAVFTAVSLTSCGEEVVVPPVKTTTTFSADNGELSGTRTSMDADRWFYWTIGDKIWVNTGSSYVMSTGSNITGNKQPRAKFTLDGNYTGTQYDVLYTGYTGTFAKDTANTSSTTVTIASQQTQSEWNNGDHLAVSGDCGKARAYRQNNGTYHFTLEHQAAYLTLFPHLHPDLANDDYTLQRIEIIATGSNIAGQYNFDYANGLADQPNSGMGGTAITLTCGDNFDLTTEVPDLSAPTTYNHCFVVIAPGTHTLTIIYVVKNGAGTEMRCVQDIASTQYSPGTVYPKAFEVNDNNVVITITEEFYEAEMYYWWDKTTPIPYPSGTTVNLANSEATSGFWGQTLSEAPYVMTPNFNAAICYLMSNATAGPIYWDNAAVWNFHRTDGTVQQRRGGAWIRKAKYIPGFTRTTQISRSRQVPTLGRPALSVIDQYFFLPGVSAQTVFWTSSSFATDASATQTNYGHAFSISSSVINVELPPKNYHRIAGTRHDGTPWFQ